MIGIFERISTWILYQRFIHWSVAEREESLWQFGLLVSIRTSFDRDESVEQFVVRFDCQDRSNVNVFDRLKYFR